MAIAIASTLALKSEFVLVHCLTVADGPSQTPEYSAELVMLKLHQSGVFAIRKSPTQDIICGERGLRNGTQKHFMGLRTRPAAILASDNIL